MNYYCKDRNKSRKCNNKQRQESRPKRFGDLSLIDNGCRCLKTFNRSARVGRNVRVLTKRPSPSDALANPMACKNAFREIFKTACLSNYNYCRKIRAAVLCSAMKLAMNFIRLHKSIKQEIIGDESVNIR